MKPAPSRSLSSSTCTSKEALISGAGSLKAKSKVLLSIGGKGQQTEEKVGA